MIQTVDEERRGIDRKFELIRVAVCGQHSSTGTMQSWNPLVKDSFIPQIVKGLAGLTHREPEHFVMALRTPPPWLLALTCLHGASPSPAHGSGAPVVPSLGSPILIAISRCSGSARECPGRNGTACAVGALSSSLILPCRAALFLLLPGAFVGAASSSSSSRTCTWAIHQIWLVQTMGKRSVGLYAPDFLSMQ